MLIGRRREQADLGEWCASSKAELVCVYGRRRVGKTYLVDNTFRGMLAFSVMGSEDKSTPTQLRVFGRALKQFGCQIAGVPADWFEAFDRLRSLLETPGVVRGSNGRRIVFLDEFPWLAGRRSNFLVAFADFWNSWASKQDDIMVVICGSATSWIIKNLFENTGSMYHRITRQLYVPPFDLMETEQMATSMGLGWGRNTVLQAYQVFGGLPYYLDMLDRRLSLAQNIDMLCFGEHAALRDETARLMEATLSDSPVHRRLIRLLSQSKTGVRRTELAEKVGSNGGSLKRALDDLEKCGYIRSYANPYERYHPTICQLVDPFLLFSLKFIDSQQVSSWMDFEGTPAYYSWRGNAFEIVCLSHVAQIKRALGIAAVQTRCFPWSSTASKRGAQIDLVIERKDGVADLCEMRFTDDPFAVDEDFISELRRKRNVFAEESKTKNALHLVLVAAGGVRQSAHVGDLAAVVTGDDLFAVR